MFTAIMMFVAEIVILCRRMVEVLSRMVQLFHGISEYICSGGTHVTGVQIFHDTGHFEIVKLN